MHSKGRFPNVLSPTPQLEGAALAILLMLLFLMFLFLFLFATVQPAQAQTQTYTIIHEFTGPEGAQPVAGLTTDAAGNLYGTTQYGGPSGESYGCGAVFKMSKKGSDGCTARSTSFLEATTMAVIPLAG